MSSSTHLSSFALLIFSVWILPAEILGKFVTAAGDVWVKLLFSDTVARRLVFPHLTGALVIVS